MNNPMKNNVINVLHLRSCHGGGGGPEKTILFSAKEADPNALRLHIAYLKSRNDPEFDLDKRAQNLGISTFTTIEEDAKFDVAALKKLLRILRENRIQILSCHCYKSDLYGLILSRFHKMKVITTVHGPLANLRFFWSAKNWRVRYLYDQVDLRLLRYFDHVLMVSNTMRPTVAKYGVKQNRLTWVKNAIDSKHFRKGQADGAAFRQNLGIPADAVVVGAVGRLNAEKDYPNLLQAAKILLSERSDLYFTIAGKGSLENELRQLAEKLGIAERVKLLGHFHDVRQVYEHMDLYVLSSTREGLPNTVLEAMAMEVPIVATDVDGVSEAATHDREALLVPPCDPAALANGIRKLLNDATLRQRLTTAARARIEQEFSFARRMQHVESIYRRLLCAQ